MRALFERRSLLVNNTTIAVIVAVVEKVDLAFAHRIALAGRRRQEGERRRIVIIVDDDNKRIDSQKSIEMKI